VNVKKLTEVMEESMCYDMRGWRIRKRRYERTRGTGERRTMQVENTWAAEPSATIHYSNVSVANASA